jgi:PAS domain S-box-containing protein
MQMREEGRSQDDSGVFEIDLTENKISWANEYAVEHTGYTLDQIKHMTLFDLVPEEFHGKMQDVIAEVSTRGSVRNGSPTSVWPVKTSGGKIIWWAVTKSVVEYPAVWLNGDHIQTTGTSGMSFLFMQAFMRAANGQSGLYEQVSELKAWTTDQIARLDEEDKRLRDGLAELESKMSDALEASKEAANAAKTTHKMMESLQKSFQEFETKYGVEILKLIGTDTIHDKRIDAFEKHVKMTTDLAVKSIEMQAQRSAQGIELQAEESSKGLSKKVVIPVTLIATIATIIQVLVEKFVK